MVYFPGIEPPAWNGNKRDQPPWLAGPPQRMPLDEGATSPAGVGGLPIVFESGALSFPVRATEADYTTAPPTTGAASAPGSGSESELIGRQLAAADELLNAYRRQSRFQTDMFAAVQPMLESETLSGLTALSRADRLGVPMDALINAELQRLGTIGKATPEEIGLIDEATNAALNRGLVDIERFETEGMRRLRDELAPSLGLRPTDTPIVDRGGMIAAEALRQRGGLSETLRAANAAQRLSYPLERESVVGQASRQNIEFLEGAKQFQHQLRQQAFANRLSLTGSTGQLGLGLTGAGNPNLSGSVNALAGTRAAQISANRPLESRSQSFLNTLSGIGSIAGGVGGILSGVGSFFGR